MMENVRGTTGLYHNAETFEIAKPTRALSSEGALHGSVTSMDSQSLK